MSPPQSLPSYYDTGSTDPYDHYDHCSEYLDLGPYSDTDYDEADEKGDCREYIYSRYSTFTPLPATNITARGGRDREKSDDDGFTVLPLGDPEKIAGRRGQEYQETSRTHTPYSASIIADYFFMGGRSPAKMKEMANQEDERVPLLPSTSSTSTPTSKTSKRATSMTKTTKATYTSFPSPPTSPSASPHRTGFSPPKPLSPRLRALSQSRHISIRVYNPRSARKPVHLPPAPISADSVSTLPSIPSPTPRGGSEKTPGSWTEGWDLEGVVKREGIGRGRKVLVGVVGAVGWGVMVAGGVWWGLGR